MESEPVEELDAKETCWRENRNLKDGDEETRKAESKKSRSEPRETPKGREMIKKTHKFLSLHRIQKFYQIINFFYVQV